MIPTQIQDNIVTMDMPAVYAYYIVNAVSKFYPLALVIDENNKLLGTIGKTQMNATNINIIKLTCGQICDRNFISLQEAEEDEIYKQARNIFAETDMDTLPVIDKNGIPVRLFGRFQAFFKDMHKKLHCYHFATGLMEAATLAKNLGHDHISAIEFGVGGGRGLIRLGICAREISRLFKIKIDVYGFDSGSGLFPPADYRDCPHLWINGDYKMDIDALKRRLYDEKLIIGDITVSTKTFLRDYSPAPIGFISVDVDTYTPTVAILDMLLADDEYYLPIVGMYFDDVLDQLGFQGEQLAIREFNSKNEGMKISPEHLAFDKAWSYLSNNRFDDADSMAHVLYKVSRMKHCLRFNHPSFSTKRSDIKNLTYLN
jgi:hypothetical protein